VSSNAVASAVCCTAAQCWCRLRSGLCEPAVCTSECSAQLAAASATALCVSNSAAGASATQHSASAAHTNKATSFLCCALAGTCAHAAQHNFVPKCAQTAVLLAAACTVAVSHSIAVSAIIFYCIFFNFLSFTSVFLCSLDAL
jgi:hypothetical protein